LEINRDLLGELGKIMNFNDHTMTWDTDIIPMKHRGTLSSLEALIEVYMSENQQQTLRDEYSLTTKILDDDYEPARLIDVIKTCESLHIEEQHQMKTLLQKYEQLFKRKLR
jgi:adenine C2-methylase RlmN of 23S rRNA A2503 and tRNA A37